MANKARTVEERKVKFGTRVDNIYIYIYIYIYLHIDVAMVRSFEVISDKCNILFCTKTVLK